MKPKNKTMQFLAILLLSLACVTSAAVIETPIEPTAEKITPTHTVGKGTKCAIVTASASLHLRRAADFESAIIGYLYHGEIVTVRDGTDPAWWTVKIGKRWGYASTDYLKAVPCPSRRN